MINRDNILNKYKTIVQNNNFKSSNVLMLVDNNVARLNYLRKIDLIASEEIKICTYSQFARQEVFKYWPVICNLCDDIVNKALSPTFISVNIKSYVFEQIILEKRNKGYFGDITGTNKSIANSIINSLDHAVYNRLDYKSVGKRLYDSKENKEKLQVDSYNQMDEVVKEYIASMLKNSVVDNVISMHLYNEYLLNDEFYLNQLMKSYDYLLVDDLQNASVAQADFIELFEKNYKEVYIYFDRSKNFSSFIKNDFDYVCGKILRQESYNNIGILDLKKIPTKIQLDQSNQLYSTMIESIVQKIKFLIKNGYRERDICLITPISTSVLDYEVSKELEKCRIEVSNTKKDNKIIDYSYGNILYVAIAIFCGLESCVKREEFIHFIQVLLNVKKTKACRIYKSNDKEYLEIIEYIKKKKSEGLNLGEFLIRFYIDKLLNLEDGCLNVSLCKNIISENESFIECVDKLSLNINSSKEEVFLNLLKKYIKDYYTSIQIEEVKNEDKVLITTPYAYISNDVQRSVQLWVDIGNNSWNMKIERELSNPIVLKKSFAKDGIYTSEMEDDYKQQYLYNSIYNIMKSSSEIYAYKSEHTIDGYIQEGGLYSLILKLISR